MHNVNFIATAFRSWKDKNPSSGTLAPKWIRYVAEAK
jgi:hypothetical protein